ncbi:fibropellin-3-like [Anneissia japonica]|uniref:fibropellin-3-like n=1 Tax=Anneissia japonica TaxID=1529436 RepID=UPI001425AC64|nr:fibropellin-3-like [Anneissia japonica]
MTKIFCDPDSDDCLGITCENGGTCLDDFLAWSCTCVEGFEGTNCETNIDECASLPCQNDGACEDGENMYTCICSGGYGGDHCELDVDDCVAGPCQNNGDCTDALNGYTCVCTSGYSGNDCETDVDECASGPCQNGGQCVDDVNMFSCVCLDGFDGTICQNVLSDVTCNFGTDECGYTNDATADVDWLRSFGITALRFNGLETGPLNDHTITVDISKYPLQCAMNSYKLKPGAPVTRIQ